MKAAQSISATSPSLLRQRASTRISRLVQAHGWVSTSSLKVCPEAFAGGWFFFLFAASLFAVRRPIAAARRLRRSAWNIRGRPGVNSRRAPQGGASQHHQGETSVFANIRIAIRLAVGIALTLSIVVVLMLPAVLDQLNAVTARAETLGRVASVEEALAELAGQFDAQQAKQFREKVGSRLAAGR
jgi:hypothetical protein